MPDYEYVLSSVDGPVGIVTLNRPGQLNALADPLLREMVDALEAHGLWDRVRGINRPIIGAVAGYALGGGYLLFATHDAHEGMHAFVDRRQPTCEGR